MAAPQDPAGRDEPDRTEPPGTGAVLLAAGVAYGAMLLAALGWLSLRDRLDQVSRTALGDHGIWVAAGAGLLAGLVGTAGLWLAARWPRNARCERRIAAILGPLPPAAVLLLATGSAIVEELFFRLAVQDAFGPVAAVACYAALNTGPGFWAWLPNAVAAGALLSLLMAGGCGLLAATAAHATMNYLTLRRILPT